MNITGAVTREASTDATGTYVFVDLPPGEYKVSVHSSGYKQTVGTGEVKAGAASRLDLTLEKDAATSEPASLPRN